MTLEPLRAPLVESMDRLAELNDRAGAVTGVPTGFTDLDNLLSGLQKSSLYIVGSRPAVGKTSFALGVAAHVAVNVGAPVALFSMQMSRTEIVQRLLCSEARVHASRLNTGRLIESDWPRISYTIGRLSDAPIFIDDSSSLSLVDIGAGIRELKASEGRLGLVVVDYLQLMAGRRDSEHRPVEASEIGRGLKVLARELHVPVIALSQLSRRLEWRSDKRPMLADLRASGELEEIADVVLFLYRDKLYNAHTPDTGLAEIIVAKHRNGPSGVVTLAFRDEYISFANLTPL